VNYLSKDFTQFEQNLLEYAKTYFPNTFKDFSPTSPGMLYIKLAAYVGDVLSFYTDYQFKEGLMPYTSERKNLIALAKYLGYKPKTTRPSFVDIEVFQIVPSIVVDGISIPDERYCLILLPDMEISTPDGQSFITREIIDFSANNEDSPREVSAFSRDTLGQVQTFLVKKTAKAQSGKIRTKTFNVSNAQEFLKLTLDESNVMEVLKVVDSDNNRWYEVEYLAQDIVYTEKENIQRNDGKLFKYRNTVPSLIGSVRTSRKFTVGINTDNKTFLEFGSGINTSDEDEIILDIKNVQRNQAASLNVAIDPSRFLQSQNYGLAPKNTTLTVTYITGGGLESNINSNAINQITNVQYAQELDDFNTSERELVLSLRNSLRVTNPESATGGSEGDSDEEIRQNSLAYFNSQNRVVTKEDYVSRILSMPSKFGSIAKVHVATDNEISQNAVNADPNLDRSFDVNVYALTYDNKKRLTKMNPAVRHNITQHLSRYRMLTDEIKLLDGFIVNIGVHFEITTFQGENKREVLANCMLAAKEFFNIDNMNFNTPINISKFELEIANIQGVQSVQNVEIRNLTKTDGDYSAVEYNIDKATINKVIYPSLDPSIFEVKYPNKDITAKAL
jgi:hypothetical protein